MEQTAEAEKTPFWRRWLPGGDKET